jgi:hypothetical protein
VARHASHFLIRFAHPTGRPSGAAQTTLYNSKKSNQKCRKLAKFDLEITYSLWDSFIQYTLAARTRTIFTRPNCSSISKFASSQYHCVAADFSKHKEATTNKFSRLLFILEHVKTVPNGRFLLLSSACRSKRIEKIKKKKEDQKLKRVIECGVRQKVKE